MPGAYVPPHMRNRAPPPAPLQPKPPLESSPAISAQRDKPRPTSTDRLNSRTPWSRATPASSSTAPPTPRDPWPTYDTPTTQGSRNSTPSVSRSSSGPGRTRVAAGSPSLYVFGDSFVGPMKLLSDECSRATTYKGSSAKGLNNPNSAKQVSKLLLPALNDLLAPPPYRYMPSIGRWALLVFGNVDLQINYLWQLQHKPLSHLSFPSKDPTNNECDTDTDDDEATPAAQRAVLARATETSLTGPALGPELFVQAVVKAYTSWLEREIVNGPIGQRIRESAKRRQAMERGETRGKVPPPGKILVAGALPPLVDDETLHRIPEKYVERLEDDHEKAQKLLESEGETWREYQMRREKSTESVEEGIATISMTDRPPTPLSGSSSSSRGTATTLESSSSSASSLDSDTPKGGINKTSIQSLLQHDPPLCTLPIRVQMTNTFNTLLRSFCDKHPTVLSFVDIGPRMLAIDATSGWDTGSMGEVDRGSWACPVDPTNVHPLWEPTLPLWLEVMKEEGLPVDGYTMEEGSEETFRAYELDKRRRTKDREGERVKIRDE